MSAAARPAAANSNAARIGFVQGQGRITRLIHEMQRDAKESVLRIGRLPAAIVDDAEPADRRTDVRVRTLADAVPLRLLLVDSEVALLPLAGEDAERLAVVVRGGPLVAALELVFEEFWLSGAPLAAAVAALPVGPDRPTEEERSILELLAAGATDDGIGRRLGISARTAHRRVRELMVRLGVRTRFQAGAQAVRLGWL